MANRAPVGIVWESFGTQSLCRSKGFEAALRYRLAKVLPMPGRCLRPRIHFHVAEHLGLGGDRLRAKCGSRAKFGNRAKFRNSSKCSSSRRTAAGQPGKRAILQRHRSVLQGPLLFGRVNHAKIVDASIGLRRSAGFHQVRNGDGRQQPDNRHDDHDLD